MRNVVCIIIALIALPCRARTITVSIDTPADFNNIHAAITDANDGDTVILMPGTYTGPENTELNFHGKQITLRSTDPTNPQTVAKTIIDCNNTARAFIFQNNETPNSILDGLTIINGYSSQYGGAIYCTQAGLTIKNCTMTKNSALRGGAIHCEDANSTIIENCVFTDNSAEWPGAVYLQGDATITGCAFRNNYSTPGNAGALSITEGNFIITDCIFQGNCALPGGPPRGEGRGDGGGMAIGGCEASLSNCLFVANSAANGGALSIGLAEVSVTNCLFVGNTASKGGVIAISESHLTAENCTFAQNRAHAGNTLACISYSGYPSLPIKIRMENSIVWDGPDSFFECGSRLPLAFCDVQGGWPGYGNIDADPCFADPGYWDPGHPRIPNDDFFVPGDYHLKSQAGRWNPDTQSWVIDDTTSPCIDAGDPNSPLGREPFPNGARVNMGCYGATAQASKSYFGKPPCQTIVAGDINGDCIVNSTDFALLSAHWSGPHYESYPAPATWPQPDDHRKDVSTNTGLGWRADCYPPRIGRDGPIDTNSSCAASHDVYLGTDYATLIYARRISPEYKGNKPAEPRTLDNYYLLPNALDPNTKYFWRIDEIGANGAITAGQIWSFTTAPNPK